MLALALVLMPYAGTPVACPLASQSQELDGVNVVEKAQHYRSVLGYGRSNSGELAAFIAYAQSFPTNLLCLVDTYDTLNSGVPNFLCVALALSDIGHKPVGIRLDSGDLAYLSKKAREMFCQVAKRFDKPFFADLMIVASNDINEPVLYALAKQVR
jgi:nicotinate phosphoribosyltransferase